MVRDGGSDGGREEVMEGRRFLHRSVTLLFCFVSL